MNNYQIESVKAELVLCRLDREEMWMHSSRVPFATREAILVEREARLVAQLARLVGERQRRTVASVAALLGRPVRRSWVRRAASFGASLVGGAS